MPRTPVGPESSLDVSPDDRLVAAARWDGTVRVWDLATGRDAFPVDPGPTQAPIMDVAWSPPATCWPSPPTTALLAG
jgi:WD40 repeat protein